MVEVWNHASASFLSIENCWGSVFEGVKLEDWWLQEQTVAMLMCLNSSGLHNLQVGHIPYFILCRCFTCMPWEARKWVTGKHIGNISILDGSVIKMPMMTPWWPLYVTGSNQALWSSVTAGLHTAISSHRVSRTALIRPCAMCRLHLTATRDHTTGHLLLQVSVVCYCVTSMMSPPPTPSRI